MIDGVKKPSRNLYLRRIFYREKKIESKGRMPKRRLIGKLTN